MNTSPLNVKELPYNLLLLTALLLFAGGFLATQTIDIHLHDTYFVFTSRFLIWSGALLFALLWVLYLATKTALFSKTLSWIHILLTIISCLVIITTAYLMHNVYEGLAAMPSRYLDYGVAKKYDYLNNLEIATWILLLILALGQIIYIVNLFVGIYKRVRRKNNN